MMHWFEELAACNQKGKKSKQTGEKNILKIHF